MSHLSRLVRRISSGARWLGRRPWLELPLLAVLVTFTLEWLSRRGLWETLFFVADSPLMFLYNALIILFTLSPALLTHRRQFSLCLVCMLWLTLGIINFVVLSYRVTPLGMIDLLLASTALRMVTTYLSPVQIGLIVVGIAAVIALGILMWKRSPRERIRPLSALVSLCVVAVAVFSFSVPSAEALSDGFGNLSEAYDDFGFAYCFSTSVIDRGIAEPEDYSEASVQAVCDNLTQDDRGLRPNVIIVQLESFFDPERYAGVTLDESPVPVFVSLRETCSSGYLSMPSIGAGTANSEFEVLTGMTMDHFGAGEYPYKTVLTDTVCESLAYDFKDIGYTATAIHNHIRSFYGRDRVFEHLGFDEFRSLEDMDVTDYTPTGWATDAVLTDEILSTLAGSEGRDFVYTITVQAHGKYTNLPGDEADPPVDEAEETARAWAYYAEQLSATDAFIGELVAALEEWEEPTVLVLFGDHLPSLEIDETLLDTGDHFCTEYVLWSNFGLEKQDVDLQAYQLGAYVQQRLGLTLGTLPALHQAYGWDDADETYQAALQTLEYDLLYGERYCYGGGERYLPTDLRDAAE